MKKRRGFFVLLGCAVFAAALCALLSDTSTPRYGGRSLRSWVAMYTRATYPERPEQRDEAAAAIRHIGTNALPLLFELIDHPGPGLWRRAGAQFSRLPEFITFHPVVRTFRQHHPVVLRPEDARSLSRALGPVATPAIPDLLARLNSTNWNGRRDLAIYALACTGPEAIRENASPWIPLLLDHPYLDVRMIATNALSGSDSGVAINAP